MSTIRIQALPKFPASIDAGDGILVERSGGVFTFSIDPGFMPTGLAIAPGKTATIGNTLTFTGTDGASVAVGAGGTAAMLGTAQTFTQKQTISPASGVNLDLGGNITPKITFNPSAGATITGSIRQTGDVVVIGAEFIANRMLVNLATGDVSIGQSGVAGSATFGNATSGTVTLQPVTGALGTRTLSLPAATDTLVGKATTDILTNKTFNTASNTFQIAGTAVTGVANGLDISSGNIQVTAARRTLPTRQVLTSGTGATYTTPANALWIEVEMVGGGAGGGGGGGAGRGDGTSGANTTFSTFTAGGGAFGATGNGGAGGTASGGQVNISGTGGLLEATLGPGAIGGSGGPSFFGGAGVGGGLGSAGGAGGSNSGGGGGGGGSTSSTVTGGGGGGSGAYVRSIINTPSGTYTYTVGAGGTGGTAGTSGGTGGAGAAGIIIVTEHYGS